MKSPSPKGKAVLLGAPWACVRLEAHEAEAPVAFVKLPTDVLKSIHLDARLSLLIAGVQACGISVPIVGVEVADMPQDPFYGYHPVVDREQLQLVARAFSYPRFCICFVNEAVIPAFEVWVVPDQKHTQELLSLSSELLTNLPENIRESVQEAALDKFQSSLLAVQQGRSPNFFLLNVPLQIASKDIYIHRSPANGEWRFDFKDEGGNLEQTIQELLETRFPGQVYRSPKVDDGSEKRQLTDVMLVTPEAVFLFESKVLALLARGLGISVDRRARATSKHFDKAVGQLVGAVKRLRNGANIYSEDGNPLSITFNGKVIHAVNVVTTELAKLDFKQVARNLTAAASEAAACYHFIDLAQLQQHVVFAESSHHLNEYFRRRFEVVSKSGNASIRTRFAKLPTISIRMPPISEDSIGYVFCFGSSTVLAEESEKICAIIFDFLKTIRFSGRCELYHRLAQLSDQARYELAIGVFLTPDFRMFEDTRRWLPLREMFARASGVKSGFTFLGNHSRNAPLSKVRQHFESVVSVEFAEGVQIAFE
jgi:hypothetical protein